MSKVSIKQVKDPAIGSHTLLEEFENLFNQVRERAYSLFQQRGGRGGECGDLDDWLRAERELLWTPPADVIDKDDQFRIHVAAPGFDAGEIEVDVASGAALAVGQTILVESEQMYITAISTNTLTVRRGVNGTTAAAHATDTDVYVCLYPDCVREATIIQTSRLWRRSDAPFGVTGSGEFGQGSLIARIDPDVKLLLQDVKRVRVG